MDEKSQARILVTVEHQNGKMHSATYDALGLADVLRQTVGADLNVAVIEENDSEVALKIADILDCTIISVRVPGLKDEYNGDAYKSAFSEIATEVCPDWICIPGTCNGLDFGPGLAVRLGAACISSVERLSIAGDGRPSFVRGMFNGKIDAELISNSRTTVLLVQPGAFKFTTAPCGRGCVERRIINCENMKSRFVGVSSRVIADSDLSKASVVVSGGRGIKAQENVELLQRFAAFFSRSSVAGSRPICEMGWLPYQHQVGQTGSIIAPDIYVACGISGSQQHLAGIKGSKFTIAINTDPEAPIFRDADIGIVEDCEQFLLELLDQIENA